MALFSNPASYARISKDKAGEELGVQRQNQDTDALATRHGLTIKRRFVDNDRSATYGGPRPDYAELVEAVKRGEVDCVLVYAMGRLWRNRAERAAGIELFREHGVSVLCVKGPQLDLTTAAGRMLAGVLGEFDTFEVEQMSEREKRKMLQNVEQGKPPTGRRCFGYSADGMEVVEDEAGIVRGMFADLLAGVSVNRITTDLNASGVLNRDGKPWSRNGVRHLLLNERFAALREYPARLKKGDPPGELYPGRWPVIVSEDTWRAASHLLRDPGRVTSPGPGRRWLLSGIALCGVCDDGTTVTAGSRGSKVKGGTVQPIYRCRKTKHLARFTDPIDDLVAKYVLHRLAAPEAADLLVDDERPDVEALRATAAALRVRLDALAAEFAEDDEADVREFRTATKRIRERLAEVEAKMAHPQRSRVLVDLVVAEDPKPVWKAMTLDRQRAVVTELAIVTLLPGRAGRVPFEERTVQIEPKD
ncbi:MAG TPA: recombinase family protein [Vicinamibacterales bacterium]|nr:recombinase family protein [Vicinamibacterales bacterium]